MIRKHHEEFDSVQDHVYIITDRELDMIILKMGSLLSIYQNKKTNQAKMLITLVEDDVYRECFLRIAELDNFQQLVRVLIERYPTLCGSKVVSSALKKHNKEKAKN